MKKQESKRREDNCAALLATREEQAVIGVLVLAPKSYGKIAGLLSSEDFEDARYRKVMEAAERLHASGKAIDSLLILRAMNLRADVEERASVLLLECAKEVPCTSNLSDYCELVKEASNKRKLVAECEKCLQLVFSGSNAKEASESLGAFTRLIMEREVTL